MSSRAVADLLSDGHGRGLDGVVPSAEHLATRFQAVRGMTEALARPLSAEDCQVQSMPDASPVKWHLAHTTWFFETFILSPHAPGYTVFNASSNYLVNSYYNAIGDRVPRSRRGLMTRPEQVTVMKNDE